MAITRVVVNLPYYTNVPEDVATNTFYFASVATPDAAARTAIALRLSTFYNAIDAYLSPIIIAGSVTATFYNMADTPPRAPVADLALATLTLGAAGYAEEAACALSYHAVAVSGESAARRRGRIFIGPLADASVTNGTTTNFSSPGPAMRSAIAAAAAVLADQSEPYQWAVYSTVDNIARQITGGWVDNSLDTQRRRGRRPTSRDVWTGQP